MRTVTVVGSYGQLAVHRETGEVLAYLDFDEPDGDYADIVRVDLVEFQQWLATQPNALPWEQIECLDICEVGFWTADGSYEDPIVDFRVQAPLPMPPSDQLPF